MNITVCNKINASFIFELKILIHNLIRVKIDLHQASIKNDNAAIAFSKNCANRTDSTTLSIKKKDNVR